MEYRYFIGISTNNEPNFVWRFARLTNGEPCFLHPNITGGAHPKLYKSLGSAINMADKLRRIRTSDVINVYMIGLSDEHLVKGAKIPNSMYYLNNIVYSA